MTYSTNWRQRFWDQVELENGCMVWTGHTVKHNMMKYGVFGRRGQYGPAAAETGEILVHRISWVLAHGPIPDGLEVRHKCDVSLCVDDGHLELGTSKQNVQDKVDRDRQIKGEAINTAVLTEGQVVSIRSQYESGGISKAQLARDYGVSFPTMCALIAGRTWKHLLPKEN